MWSFDEIADWMTEAGLAPQKPIMFLTVPGVGLQVGVKR